MATALPPAEHTAKTEFSINISLQQSSPFPGQKVPCPKVATFVLATRYVVAQLSRFKEAATGKTYFKDLPKSTRDEANKLLFEMIPLMEQNLQEGDETSRSLQPRLASIAGQIGREIKERQDFFGLVIPDELKTVEYSITSGSKSSTTLRFHDDYPLKGIKEISVTHNLLTSGRTFKILFLRECLI